MNVCRHCKKREGVIVDVKNTYNGKIYRYYSCTECSTNRMKKYRSTEQGKKSYRKAVKKYQSNNPQRRAAWNAARAIPLQPCEVCGDNKRVHRHHPDPANKLEIVFLCPLHHKRAHMVK